MEILSHMETLIWVFIWVCLFLDMFVCPCGFTGVFLYLLLMHLKPLQSISSSLCLSLIFFLTYSSNYGQERMEMCTHLICSIYWILYVLCSFCITQKSQMLYIPLLKTIKTQLNCLFCIDCQWFLPPLSHWSWREASFTFVLNFSL